MHNVCYPQSRLVGRVLQRYCGRLAAVDVGDYAARTAHTVPSNDAASGQGAEPVNVDESECGVETPDLSAPSWHKQNIAKTRKLGTVVRVVEWFRRVIGVRPKRTFCKICGRRVYARLASTCIRKRSSRRHVRVRVC